MSTEKREQDIENGGFCAYKFRMYPNTEQQEFFAKCFDAAEWVYNKCLEVREGERSRGEAPSSAYDLQKMLKAWKSEEPWLSEADHKCLASATEDLTRAFRNHSRKRKPAGFPKRKEDRPGRRTYRTKNSGGTIRVPDRRHIRLPKIGVVRCRVHREVEGRILNATVERTASGEYYVSLCCADVPEKQLPEPKAGIIGVDVGIKDTLIRSDGVKEENARALAKLEKRLAFEEARLSRKVPGSNRYEEQRKKVAKLHARIRNVRLNSIHNATARVVRDAGAVAVEDLNVAGMMRNRRLSKSLADASMGEALRQLEYKSERGGRDFVKVGRYYPSSKTCSACGHVLAELRLEQREWTCPECGARHDRDLNAARNIAREGARLIEQRHGQTA